MIKFLLQANKVLYVPTPRLRHGLLNKITPPICATKRDLHICATSEVSYIFKPAINVLLFRQSKTPNHIYIVK